MAADPQAKIAGLHIYTFNQVAGTERWLSQWLEELGGREEQGKVPGNKKGTFPLPAVLFNPRCPSSAQPCSDRRVQALAPEALALVRIHRGSEWHFHDLGPHRLADEIRILVRQMHP